MRMSVESAVVLALIASPAPAGAARPICTDASRACLLATATLYLEGLSRHDSSKIPFTPDVRATEQRNVVVTDEAKFRAEIDSSTAIIGARNIRLMADPQSRSVAAFYMLDIAGENSRAGENSGAGENSRPKYSVWRGQRFRIVKGRVSEVEVYNYIEPDPTGLGPQLWPGGMTLSGKP